MRNGKYETSVRPGEEVNSVMVIIQEGRAQMLYSGDQMLYHILSMKSYTTVYCSLIVSLALILFPQPDCKFL